MPRFRVAELMVVIAITAIDILNDRVIEAFDEFRTLFAAPVTPNTATSVTPASVITDPGAVVEEVDAVRQEVAQVEPEHTVIAAPKTAPKTAVSGAKAGRRPTARS